MSTGRYASLIHNLLDTICSRNSGYRGYWMFGFLEREIDNKFVIDLLDTQEIRTTIFKEFLNSFVNAKYRELVKKRCTDGIRIDRIEKASVQIKKGKACEIVIYGKLHKGFLFHIEGSISLWNGKRYTLNKIVFAAHYTQFMANTYDEQFYRDRWLTI